MNENVHAAVEALLNDDKVEFQRYINDELDARANAAIDSVKPIVAANLFGMETEGDEDDD